MFLLSRAGGLLSAVLLSRAHHGPGGLLEGGLEGDSVHPGLSGGDSLDHAPRARSGGGLILCLLLTAILLLIV